MELLLSNPFFQPRTLWLKTSAIDRCRPVEAIENAHGPLTNFRNVSAAAVVDETATLENRSLDLPVIPIMDFETVTRPRLLDFCLRSEVGTCLNVSPFIVLVKLFPSTHLSGQLC